MTRTNFLQLQPCIRPVPAQVICKYFTVERAAKTLHRMSLCTPVSVPAKITWKAVFSLFLLVESSSEISELRYHYLLFLILVENANEIYQFMNSLLINLIPPKFKVGQNF